MHDTAKPVYQHEQPITVGRQKIELYIDDTRATLRWMITQPRIGIITTTWHGTTKELCTILNGAEILINGDRRIELDSCSTQLTQDDQTGSSLVGPATFDLNLSVYTALRIELNLMPVH